MTDTQAHWDHVWTQRDPEEVSWYQAHPQRSLRLIDALDLDKDAAILDVGGGASTLTDHLLAAGYRDITVLDIAAAALDVARARLRENSRTRDTARHVHWLRADILKDTLKRPYDLWHDRAVFHFLTDVADREAYKRQLEANVPVGGHVLLATFGPDGPEKCSGLPVRRYSVEDLGTELGYAYALVDDDREQHTTPSGERQSFVYGLFERTQ